MESQKTPQFEGVRAAFPARYLNVARACSTDETRGGITHILVEASRLVATDGHMLAVLDLERPILEGDGKLMIPGPLALDALATLDRLRAEFARDAGIEWSDFGQDGPFPTDAVPAHLTNPDVTVEIVEDRISLTIPGRDEDHAITLSAAKCSSDFVNYKKPLHLASADAVGAVYVNPRLLARGQEIAASAMERGNVAFALKVVKGAGTEGAGASDAPLQFSEERFGEHLRILAMPMREGAKAEFDKGAL